MNGFGTQLPGKTTETGVALIVVLWLLVLLTIMAGSYSHTMRTETLTTAAQVHSAEARALAEAGIWLAANDLLKPVLERSWSSDGRPLPVFYAGSEILVSIQDEAGKIDINTADQLLLGNLLRLAGADASVLDQLVDSILDWRDKDQLSRLHGAEDAYYKNAGLEYEAKDGPFNTVEELRLVAGMSEELFQKIRPSLTVHSLLPGINPEFATRNTLLALPGSTEAAVDDYLEHRREQRGSLISGINNKYISKAGGKTFSISSTGTAAASSTHLQVVIMMKSTADRPVSVLSWREASPVTAAPVADDSK